MGEYEILEALDEAGLAAVHRGLTPEGETVAIKILRVELVANSDARRRFVESVEAARLVPPEGTVRILDADLQVPRPYAVLEYVKARTLLDHVREHGPLTGAEIHRLAVVTSSVLAATHGVGVLHRNLKPRTVLMSDKGPLVAGYGYARRVEDLRAGPEERPGTPPYFVPELLVGELESPASDVFAWGLTMSYAATGGDPFGTGPLATVIDRVLHQAPDLTGIPGWLADLVVDALAKNPADRPAFEELVARLWSASYLDGQARSNTGGSLRPPPRPASASLRPESNATLVDGDPGLSLRDYEIFEPLGQGGMAIVYRARHLTLGRDVAIKVVHSKIIGSRERRRFQREVDAAVRLSEHPGVVTLYDAGTFPNGSPYLIMELCPQGSLADRLTGEGSLDADEVTEIGIQVADALAAAHRLGILHRDIKPANLLVTRFGRVALTDFGIAVLSVPGHDHSLTFSMTPSYAPPEVFEGGAPTPAGDLYSLGATLYALLRGHPPRWPGKSVSGPALVAHFYRTRNDPLPDLDGVPEPLMAVIRQCAHPDPLRRYPDATSLKDALKALQ